MCLNSPNTAKTQTCSSLPTTFVPHLTALSLTQENLQAPVTAITDGISESALEHAISSSNLLII